MHYFTNYFL